jgi:hypothetical protein
MKHILTSVSRNDGSVPALNQSGKLLDTPIRFEVTASNDPSVLCGSRNGYRSMTSSGSCLAVMAYRGLAEVRLLGFSLEIGPF